MTDELIRTLSTGVMATLLVFELVVALTSWLETREATRSNAG